MDRVWDTSKYHPKPWVSIFKVKVIQDHEGRERSNWKFYVWTAWYMFFVKNSKNYARTLIERPKSDEIWKSGKCRNPREQREKWPFSTYRIPKLGHFQDIYLNFCAHIHILRFFHIYSGFLKIQKKSLIF